MGGGSGWRAGYAYRTEPGRQSGVLAGQRTSPGHKADPVRLLATTGLLLGSLVLVAAAGPLQAFMQATAAQLLDLRPYLQIVQGGAA